MLRKQAAQLPKWRAVAVDVMALWALGVLIAGSARAQDHHERWHADYQGWINKDGTDCCDNRHCGDLADKDERTSNGILEVRIEGSWCPVLSKHYLKTGNVPNAASSHVCVRRPNQPWLYAPEKTPCDRLLCYQPRPGS